MRQPRGIIEHLKAALAYLKKLAVRTLSPQIEADIAHIKEVLGQWERGESSRTEGGDANGGPDGKLRASPVWTFSSNPDPEKSKGVVAVWRAIAEHDEAFQYGRTGSASAQEIAEKVSTPRSVVTAEDNGSTVRFSTAKGYLEIKDADTPRPYISSTKANSQGQKSAGGAQLYQAALDWIHNNGKTIKDDPGGLSLINSVRRTSNFLSSALRHGTTRHLSPHSFQFVDWREGDDDFNLASLALAERDNVFLHIAEAEHWSYDFAHERFIDARGTELTVDDFERIVLDSNPAESGIGVATLQRVVVTNTALQRVGGSDAEDSLSSAQSSSGGLSAGLGERLRGVLYASPLRGSGESTPLKARADKPASWAEVKPGHTWASSKRFLPKLADKRPGFGVKRGSWEFIVEKVAKWLGDMPQVDDPWGAQVNLANPQKKGRFTHPLENRAAHLVGKEEEKGTEKRTLHPDKLAWIGAVKTTISDAQARVRASTGETLYFRNYLEGMHMVVVEDGAVKDQYALITQYAPELSKTRFEGAVVEQVRQVSGLAPQGGPGSIGIPAQPQSQTAQTPSPGAQD